MGDLKYHNATELIIEHKNLRVGSSNRYDAETKRIYS